jgi:alkyl hydroperoxide reductase subunit AhpF
LDAVKAQYATRAVFTVYLNGLVHTDDRMALQEMVSALSLDNAIDEAAFVRAFSWSYR